MERLTGLQEFTEGFQGLWVVNELSDGCIDSLRIRGKDNLLVEVTDHYFRTPQLVPDVEKLFFNRSRVSDRHGMLDPGIGQGFHFLPEIDHSFPDLFTLIFNADADVCAYNQGHAYGEG